jgi:antitoxin (DNA-binding transcriptional repressor) of toxin-antitoxin stability system
MRVPIHEAKTHLSRLIAAVERGEEVIISRRDKPMVELRALESAAKNKRSAGCGVLAGYFSESAIAHLTNDRALDKKIEEDFESVEEDWK